MDPIQATPERSGSDSAGGTDSGPVVLTPIRWRDRLSPRSWWRTVRIDFAARSVRQGKTVLPLDRLEIIDLRGGVVGISDGERWICFDALGFRAPEGPLTNRRGEPKEFFGGLLRRLQSGVVEARLEQASAAPGETREIFSRTGSDPPRFDFRFMVKLDLMTIFLTAVCLAIFVGYQYYLHGRIPLKNWSDGSGGFLAVLAGLLAAYALARVSSRATFDRSGVTLRRLLLVRRVPWDRVLGVRQQGLEVELETRGRSVSLHLDVLRGRGSPLVLRRGMRPVLTPLGVRFFAWVCAQAPLREEVPVFGSRRDRFVGRIWLGVLITLNTVFFVMSRPPGLFGGRGDANPMGFQQRLVKLGARTDMAMEEQWRFLTANFLHGDVVHFGFNMFMIAILAPWLGRIFGWWRATLIYLGSGFLGNSIAQQFTAPPVFSVGASTAILGVLGAFYGAIFRRPHSVPLAVRARFRWLPVFLLITLASGMAFANIDNWAHFGGFLAGFVLAWIIPPRLPVAAAARPTPSTGPSPPVTQPAPGPPRADF